jgi:hypothetical protein
MKVEGDKIKFLDKEDKAAFQRLLFQFEKKGHKTYILTVDVSTDSISEKQEKLFEVLVNKVADASGQDKSDIEETLIKNYGNGKNIKDFSKEEFQNFIELTSAFSIDFFGFSINFDSKGHVQINKI